MKYKLIIDKEAEEEIRVIAHGPSLLTQQIEDLVFRFSGADSILDTGRMKCGSWHFRKSNASPFWTER